MVFARIFATCGERRVRPVTTNGRGPLHLASRDEIISDERAGVL